MREQRLNLKRMQDETDDSLLNEAGDAVLDQVLRGYAAATPREGFEARILARIDAEGGAREKRKSNFGWLIPALSGLGLVSVALALVIVLQPGKKEVGVVEQPTAQQNLNSAEHEAAIVQSSAYAPESVKKKSAAITQSALPQTSTNNFKAEQHRLMLQLMSNAPEAIATLAQMDREQASDDAFIRHTTPIEVKLIEFQPIKNEPIEFNDTPTTQNYSSDAASK